MSGLPNSTNSNNKALLVTDLFSMVTRYFPMPTRTAAETIRALKLIMSADVTTIQYLRSDQETCLMTKEFQDFCTSHGIRHETTSANSPRSNSSAELQVKGFKMAVKYLTKMLPSCWDQHLHLITCSHAKAVAVHGTTPEKAHFGYTSMSPLTLLPKESAHPLEEAAIKELHDNIKSHMEARRQQRADKEATRRDYRSGFRPGVLVLYKENPICLHSAVKQRYSGPYVIESLEENSYSCTIKNLQSNTCRKAAITNLKILPPNSHL